MYLAYLDDSAVTDERGNFAVFAAALLHEQEILGNEDIAVGLIAELVGEDKLDEFREFKAFSLFRGKAPFDSIPQDRRFRAIEGILNLIDGNFGTCVVYGAVDKEALRNSPIASASPADLAFRKCVRGIEEYLGGLGTGDIGYTEESALLILDDTDDTNLKQLLRTTYRTLRRRGQSLDYDQPDPTLPDYKPRKLRGRGQLHHFHDDLYFGASSDSLGLQMADMCAYFIGLHLRDASAAEPFYGIFKEHIKCSGLVSLESVQL